MIDNQFLQGFRQLSDNAGDSLISQLYEELTPKEIGRLYQESLNSLEEADVGSLPPAMQQFFSQNQDLPSWADRQQMQKAEEFFLELGPEYAIALLCRALPVGYVAANTVKVLTSTGYLSSDIKTGTAKRLLETTQFILDVMNRDALRPNGRGVKSILKVRFIHSMVRYHLLRHNWDSARYGIPVNQEDMAGTIMTFSVAAIMGMERLNIRLSMEQKDALVHFWSVVGHVIGVDKRINPESYSEAKPLYEAILSHQAARSEDGIRLTGALTGFVGKVLDFPMISHLSDYLVRYLIGEDRYSDMLNLSTPESLQDRLLFDSSVNALRTINKYRGNILADQLSKPVNRILATRLLAYFSDEFDMKLHFPPEIKSAWGIIEKDDMWNIRGFPVLTSVIHQIGAGLKVKSA